MTGQGDRREPQSRGPSFGPLVQQRYPGLGQPDTRGVEKLTGFALAEAQIGRADLGQLAGQPQLMQAQPQIATGGQDRVCARGKVRQQAGELTERVRQGQFVQIINDHREVARSIDQLREHPVDHRRFVEVGCRRGRFRATGCPNGLADRPEQVKPEQLRVALVASELHDGEPVRLTRPLRPGAQQRRLPAAGRSRDDRHLLRRRAIQHGEKITPVDQPGARGSHRQRRCLGTYAFHPSVDEPTWRLRLRPPGQRTYAFRTGGGVVWSRGGRLCARQGAKIWMAPLISRTARRGRAGGGVLS